MLHLKICSSTLSSKLRAEYQVLTQLLPQARSFFRLDHRSGRLANAAAQPCFRVLKCSFLDRAGLLKWCRGASVESHRLFPQDKKLALGPAEVASGLGLFATDTDTCKVVGCTGVYAVRFR
jgi:hypothetical protein